MQKNIRQLAAVMFTDMVGYTALMQTDEQKAKKNHDRHRKVLEKSTQDQHGLILQYYGDGTLSVFGSAIEAVECAVEIQKELQKEPNPAISIQFLNPVPALHIVAQIHRLNRIIINSIDTEASLTQFFSDFAQLAGSIPTTVLPNINCLFICNALNFMEWSFHVKLTCGWKDRF